MWVLPVLNAVALLLQMRTVHQCVVLLLVSVIAVSAQPFQPGQNVAPLGKYMYTIVELRNARVCAQRCRSVQPVAAVSTPTFLKTLVCIGYGDYVDLKRSCCCRKFEDI